MLYIKIFYFLNLMPLKPAITNLFIYEKIVKFSQFFKYFFPLETCN